jgi:hypothetical protein
MDQKSPNKTSIWLLIVLWLYVAIPLFWGVASTINKAMALFG